MDSARDGPKDRITDFSAAQGDKIDLSAIYAGTLRLMHIRHLSESDEDVALSPR